MQTTRSGFISFQPKMMEPATYPKGVSPTEQSGIISYSWLAANRQFREPAAATVLGTSESVLPVRTQPVAGAEFAAAERVPLTPRSESARDGLDGYFNLMREKETALFGERGTTHTDYRARRKPHRHGSDLSPWFGLFRPDEPAAGPEIVVFRANGMEPQKKPEWTSKMPLASAKEDTRALVEIVREATPFIDSQWGKSKLAQFFMPRGFHFADKVANILVGADPSPGDEEGFANASAGMDEHGNLVLMSGADPKPGSDASKVTAPVWRDKSVFRHEMGHTLVDEIFRSFGLQLLYEYQAGAGFHESFADCLAITMHQIFDLGGRQLTQADADDFKIGDVMVIGAALRHALLPGHARRADHEFGPDLQEAHLDGFSNSDPVHQKMLQGDTGGVHHQDSIANLLFSKVVTGINSRENAQIALTIFMGAEILAAATGNNEATYTEQAQFWIASAYIEFGIKAAELVRASAEQVGALPSGFPEAAEMINQMGIKDLETKMSTPPAAVAAPRSRRRAGGRG